jgi:hypothetical protein
MSGASIKIREIYTMGAGHRLSLIFALAVLPACLASAQTRPWPTDAPQGGQQANPAWPDAGAPAAAPATAPLASPAPMMLPGYGTPDLAAAPQGPAAACIAEFTKLREDVEKRGKAARAASERKASREEMCKHITGYSTAEQKWYKFTEENTTKCGIPPQIAQQLKTMHTHTEQTRANVCSPAAAGPAPPSLADALGTTRLPTPETTKTGSGTLDTLTGNAIQNR